MPRKERNLDKKNEILLGSMEYIKKGYTISEISEKFGVSYSYIYSILDEIAEFNNIPKYKLLDMKLYINKRIENLFKEANMLKSCVLSIKNKIADSTKVDFSLIGDGDIHGNESLSKLKENIKLSKDTTYLENMISKLNYSLLTYKIESHNILREITLILDEMFGYFDKFNEIEKDISSFESRLSEVLSNLNLLDLENDETPNLDIDYIFVSADYTIKTSPDVFNVSALYYKPYLDKILEYIKNNTILYPMSAIQIETFAKLIFFSKELEKNEKECQIVFENKEFEKTFIMLKEILE